MSQARRLTVMKGEHVVPAVDVEGGDPRPARAGDRAAARAAAFDLVIDAQTSGSSARGRAAALSDRARRAAWPDVRAIADYAIDTVNLWTGPHAAETGEHRRTFVSWARRSEDPFALALALVARAESPERDEAHRIDDLVDAYEAAERITAQIDRAFALHEIGGAFHDMWLWELTREMFHEVGRLSAGLDGPSALVGALALNTHYIVACDLLHAREIGDVAAIVRGREQVEALRIAPASPTVPEAWRPTIAAWSAMCDVLATHRGEDRITALLDAGTGHTVHDQAVTGLLHCVLGWHRLEHDRFADADVLIRAGAAMIGDSTDRSFDVFVRWLAARLHDARLDGETRAALTDYRGALIRAREDARHALVRSVRERMRTGRLRAERDRYARESLTDPLTGLANRRALEARLRTVSASSVLIMIDIDQFKPVNDRFGHDVGDRVLRRVGEILLDCIRPGDMAARLGGDEFVVVLDAVDRDVAVRRSQEVRERVANEPWRDLHDDLAVAVSVGVAWGAPDGLALYRDADEGLYEAKRAGGDCVRGGRTTRTVAGPTRQVRT